MEIKNHFGKVYLHILKEIEEKGGLTFLVIDPPNQTPETAAKIASLGENSGLDAVVVGGSVGAQGEILDKTIISIKEKCSLPVILFPGNIATLSKYADAAYFMCLMNSLDPYYISGAQTAASFPVKQMKLETIPTSYIVVEPGRAVGFIGKVQTIPRNMPYLAAASALGGQLMGSHLIILESGGGAPEPAPIEMVRETARTIDVPLIVAGGVRNEKWAYKMIKAGASAVHVGAAFERTKGDMQKVKRLYEKLTASVRKAGREKR